MSDISKIQVGETLYDVKDQTARDNFTNAKITTINNLSDDNHIPTAKAVYDYLNDQRITSVDMSSKLPTSNAVYNFVNNMKTYSISSSSTDTQIPTAKAVYDYIQNNGGGGAASDDETFGSPIYINPSEYYVVQTAHIDATNLKEENMFDGMYQASTYTQTDGIYKFTNLNTGEVFYRYPLKADGMLVMQGDGAISVNGVYSFMALDFETYIFTQDTTLNIPDEEGSLEITLPAGFYVGVQDEDFAYTIQHLRKKENYIIANEYVMTPTEDILMDVYYKVSDNIDYSGLYSAQVFLVNTSGNSISADIQYDCGGYFQPIGEIDPDFDGIPAYGLNANALLKAQYNIPAAIIVTQAFTIPAGMMNNDEDINVSAGTYLFARMGSGVPSLVLELVKLQEKEEILDIDSLFGPNLEAGTFTETLNSLIMTTGTANLTLSNTDFVEGAISANAIYNLFNSAFERGGKVYLKLHGTFGNAYTNMLCPTTMWKSNDTVGAATTLTLYTNNAWITYKLQIYSYETHFSIYCEGSVAQ